MAVLMALIGLFGFVAIVRLGFKASDGDLGTRSNVVLTGCVLFTLFALAWGYLSAGTLVFRARSVTELGDSHFTVLSIFSLLFRLNGKLMFVTCSQRETPRLCRDGSSSLTLPGVAPGLCFNFFS
jgi:hypothetical protein